jgi:hypothetical protein
MWRVIKINLSVGPAAFVKKRLALLWFLLQIFALQIDCVVLLY